MKARSATATQPPGTFNARHGKDTHVAIVAARITRRTPARPRRADPTTVNSEGRPRPEQWPGGQRHSARDTVGARPASSQRHQGSAGGEEGKTAIPLLVREGRTTAQSNCHSYPL